MKCLVFTQTFWLPSLSPLSVRENEKKGKAIQSNFIVSTAFLNYSNIAIQFSGVNLHDVEENKQKILYST